MRNVYFALRRDGAIKIGCSRNPRIRCRSIGYTLKQPVILLAEMPGRFRDERALHRRFDAYRLEGEWFRPHQAILSVIAGVLAGELPIFTWVELADAHLLKAAA